MVSGIVCGILPASIRMSPAFSSLILSLSALTLSGAIYGPMPLISVPSMLFSLTLIRDIPSSSSRKSVLIPSSVSLFLNSSPTKPARNPSAVLSKPRFLSTYETLIPLPPASICSYEVRFVTPSLKSSTPTI